MLCSSGVSKYLGLLPPLLLFLVQVYNLSMIIQETDLQHLHVREFIFFKSDLCLLFWAQSSLPPRHSCSQTTGDLPWSKTPTSNHSRYVLCTVYCLVYTFVGPFSHCPRFICFQHARSHFTLGWAEFVFKILHKFKSVLTPLVTVRSLGNDCSLFVSFLSAVTVFPGTRLELS